MLSTGSLVPIKELEPYALKTVSFSMVQAYDRFSIFKLA